MRIPTNTIRDISSFYYKELEGVYTREELKSILYILYEHFLGLSKIQVVTEENRRVNESDLILLYKGMKAIKRNVPVQYVVKKCNFFNLNFYVDQRVLIPRQETEELIQWILQDYYGHSSCLEAIDLCTGSGCIAISIQKNIKIINMSALDLSEDALEVAKINSQRLLSDISLIKGDILDSDTWSWLKMYDLIVSNPPYVTNSEKKLMHNNVLNNEPHLALFVDDEDPLLYYRAILINAKEKLKTNGAIYFEINEGFGSELLILAKELGYTNAEIRKDINGKDRMMKVGR